VQKSLTSKRRKHNKWKKVFIHKAMPIKTIHTHTQKNNFPFLELFIYQRKRHKDGTEKLALVVIILDGKQCL